MSAPEYAERAQAGTAAEGATYKSQAYVALGGEVTMNRTKYTEGAELSGPAPSAYSIQTWSALGSGLPERLGDLMLHIGPA
jgi:hypothetical protein